jgi:hypothetical protein
MEIIGYVAIGFIGLVLCLWLISLVAYAAAQKHTARLFERDPVDPPISAVPERRCDVVSDMDARAPTAAKSLDHESVLLPVCIDGDKAELAGRVVEAPRSRDQTVARFRNWPAAEKI